MPKQQKNTNKISWTGKDMDNALLEISAGSLVRPTAKKYGMSEGILRKRMKMRVEGKILVGSGRKPV